MRFAAAARRARSASASASDEPANGPAPMRRPGVGQVGDQGGERGRIAAVAATGAAARDGASVFKAQLYRRDYPESGHALPLILRRMAATRRTSPYLLLTLTPFFWACNWIIGRGLHDEIPPMAMTFFRWFFAILILAPFAWRYVRARLAGASRATGRSCCLLGRDRRRHAQRPRLPRPQLHDGDQRRHPQFVHSGHDRHDLVGVPARAAGAAAGRRRGDVARRRADDPVGRQPRNAARVPPQRRRPVHHPVDGDVVGLHDRAALAARRACT